MTRSDLAGLARFAGYRLARVGLDPFQGEDVAQEAVLAVLRGSESPHAGRHPRPVDLQDSASFLDYLKGVIGSLVEAERRRLAHRFEPLGAAGTWQGSDWPATPSELEFNDLRREFFTRLAFKAPGPLLPMVLAWEKQADGVIPLLGRHRRARQQLKQLAQKVLKELLTPARNYEHR